VSLENRFDADHRFDPSDCRFVGIEALKSSTRIMVDFLPTFVPRRVHVRSIATDSHSVEFLLALGCAPLPFSSSAHILCLFVGFNALYSVTAESDQVEHVKPRLGQRLRATVPTAKPGCCATDHPKTLVRFERVEPEFWYPYAPLAPSVAKRSLALANV